MATKTKTNGSPKFIPPAIERTRQWVDNRWMENPSFRAAAAEAGISDFHSHRLFKRLTGKTLKQYVDGYRVIEAQRLLASGLEIAEVAALMGFAHQSHFTSRFRQLVGLPPAKWLRAQRLEAVAVAA